MYDKEGLPPATPREGTIASNGMFDPSFLVMLFVIIVTILVAMWCTHPGPEGKTHLSCQEIYRAATNIDYICRDIGP